MLRVVSVSDKVGTAIDRLCKGVAPYHENLDYIVCDVHPKRPDPEQLSKFEQAAASADIIDFQYFRTALSLLERYPWLKEKKLILTHNNGYSWKDGNWDEFDHVVANNHDMKKGLEKLIHNPAKRLSYIPLATDPTFWKFNFDWEPSRRVIMVANRIEAKKGILEVAIACGDLGLTLVLVGSISDREYFHSILQCGHVEFHEQITDEELRDLYYGSVVHVCNSVDNFESGTLPILEAMQCGVPVLTRNIGHVPDLNNGENLVLLDGQDVMEVTAKLEEMLGDKKKLFDQREKAWKTAKDYNMERRAYSYQRLYRSMFPGEPVSIIVPIYDKPETIRACLNAIADQDYPNIEVIAVDDSDTMKLSEQNEDLVNAFAKTVSFPVRYLLNFNHDYGLARARNKGIIEATGDILVFCDQRQIMAPNAVSEFVKNLTPKAWLYGDKGSQKQNFIENFSCVGRTDIIEAGMFNERITAYGGMSQEIRNRTRQQGFKHIYIESAKAQAMGKSSNKNRKKQEILAMKNLLWKLGL
jgi:glycosyltransferase involved in cell wall biosynthesis